MESAEATETGTVLFECRFRRTFAWVSVAIGALIGGLAIDGLWLHLLFDLGDDFSWIYGFAFGFGLLLAGITFAAGLRQVLAPAPIVTTRLKR